MGKFKDYYSYPLNEMDVYTTHSFEDGFIPDWSTTVVLNHCDTFKMEFELVTGTLFPSDRELLDPVLKMDTAKRCLNTFQSGSSGLEALVMPLYDNKTELVGIARLTVEKGGSMD